MRKIYVKHSEVNFVKFNTSFWFIFWIYDFYDMNMENISADIQIKE